MEATIIEHPLWAGATNEEVDCAMEGLEKYVMTKLFSRTFTASPEDVKIDREIFEKIQLLQTFLRPEHLDIPKFLQNEASWLLAEKELQKINAFKAPREKLLCIMSCCRVINNLLLNASISENHALGGADDFLPVLIYVTIKANPPQLHSNLKFIQLYRRQAKLVSEAAYYFTNLVSAKSFIIDLNAKSLSMDEIEFEQSTLHYPYMEAEAGELTVKDVERLLSLYKDVVTKYTSLCSAVRRISESGMVPSHPIFRGTSAFSSQVEGQPEGTDVSVDVKEEEQSRKQICK
ncbi:hypothetical protein GH714_014141 [Hevea brasiliensis]|uniref:VPS9 domain-containing protein n=1 Tax=Hevea brasiliensis TaxID=3981 RepID=A0A6A6L6E4_HEVBR|nr:hypothetical protein GH714_014141 [Hevea brasiliensis]